MDKTRLSIVLMLFCVGIAVLSIVVMLFRTGITAHGQSTNHDYVTTDDGTKLLVKKSGTGPICIFIHGGPGAWSKSFEGLVGDNLEKNLSMVYYDQRGCGRSQKAAEGDYSLTRMVKDIDLIREHYGATKVYLMTHSFGGILALNYALSHPDRVEGLILVNSTLSMRYSIEGQINYINHLLQTNYAAPDSTSASLISTFMKAKKALTQKGLAYKMLSDNKINVDRVEEIDTQNPSDYDFAKHVFTINDYWRDYTPMTQEVRLPVLIITGEKDHSIGKNHFSLFHFTNGNVRKINGGHILYYEKNKEFVTSILGFIDGN